MKPKTHDCAVCRATIPAWLLFCAEHYRLVPKSLKHELHEEYRYMKRAETRNTERWLELRAQAIATVKEKLHKRHEKKRNQGDLLAAA